MDSSLDVVMKIREEQLRKSIRFVAVFGFFLLLAPISRAYELGWDNMFYLYISLYLLVLGLAFFDRHLGYRAKAIITIILAFILGMAGLLAWGLISFGFLALFTFCIITTMLFGTRAGVLSVILSILATAVIGTGFVTEFLSANFNTSDFLRHYSLWASSIIGIVFSAGILVIGLSSINNRMLELLKKLDDKNSQLQDANARLTESLEERKRLESSLVRAEKMELVGTIAGGVAHDLNNVLSGAVNYPELVLLGLSEKSELRKPMEAILRSSNRAAAIVHDLLTLTRRGVLAEEVANINQVVKECLAGPEFEKIMKYHPGVQLEVSLDEDLCNIIGSPLHLFKTLLNLISNAAEAMPGGGLVRIETSNQFLGRTFYGFERVQAGDYVVLKISDTGSGIPQNEMKRIFEPFYTKKVMGRSGTGLGMTVVWNTVKDHKGYIDLTSTAGKGTSFTLFFPATAKPLEQEKPGPAVTEYKGQGESILVVDDLEDQREIASMILSALGYSVHTVPSGESAMEYLREHSPDLVILDMVMAPGMDGLATYKEIIKLHPKQKVLIVSGFSETDQIREAQKLGAGAFILKPYTMEKIGLAVRGELGWKN